MASIFSVVPSDHTTEAKIQTLAATPAAMSAAVPAAMSAATPAATLTAVVPISPEVKEEEARFYCEACNRDAGTMYSPTCPYSDCRSFRTVVQGRTTKVGSTWIGGGGKPQLISDVSEQDFEKLSTGTREFDRVLGGGLTTGSTVLISGDPGIGKSTLLLQVAIDLTAATITDENNKEVGELLSVLYVSAEETASQIKGRGLRLMPDLNKQIPNPIKDRAKEAAKISRRLYIYNESDVVEIARYVAEIKPSILIIDSIQTMLKPGVSGHAGSVTQAKECTSFIVRLCKEKGIGCFLVAHVTKDGEIAGPKMLEHLVDATFEFHKEGTGELRSIRPNKNRFGTTNEMALFRMTGDGLKSIENPNELLIEHHVKGKPGVCIGLASSGPRPFAMEVQVLLGPPAMRTFSDNGNETTNTRQQFKRVIVGMSTQRANQVIAILQRRYGLELNREIYINVPGDHDEVKDPAFDLPLALALVSYCCDVALPESVVAYGEIGLAGEVRPVTYSESRIKAAALMKFKTIVGPKVPSYEAASIVAGLMRSDCPSGPDGDGKVEPKERYFGVKSLEEALETFEGLTIIPPAPKQSKVRLDRQKQNPEGESNES